MSAHDVTLNLSERGGQIVLDGQDVSRSVTALQLRARARNHPELVLALTVGSAPIQGHMDVTVDDDTAALLRTLGWEKR